MRAAVLLLLSTAAFANPKTLPFSYGTATSPKGGLEVEQYVDLVPVKVTRELTDGNLESTWAMRFALQTEIELGITDDLEVGFYLAFRQGATGATPFLRFQGIKQRIRWRLSNPGEWPVDVALYLEVAEFYNELEFEEKILLQRRFGPFTAVANLWVEQEYYFTTGDSRFIYNPTVGVTYELAPSVVLGLEYWARGRFGDADVADSSDPEPGARHYLGPTVMVAAGEHWLAFGLYLRLDDLGTATAIDDPYGRVWARVIVGLGL